MTETDSHGTADAADPALAELAATEPVLAELASGSGLSLAETADRLDAVHATLQAALADLDRS